MPAKLRMEGDTLYLSIAGCRGMEFKDALEKIKGIPGRRWDAPPGSKDWMVPATPSNAERILKSIKPEADQELLNWVSASKISEEESLTSPLPDDADDLALSWAYKRASWQPEFINDEPVTGLLPEQRAAVSTMVKWKRAILADDMGKGKTVQAIATIEEYRERNQVDGPKLIVAPKSVKGTWARELNTWLDEPVVEILEGASPAKRKAALEAAIEENAWVIVNWEQLRLTKATKTLRNGGKKQIIVMKEPLFEETEWLAVIADEAHRAKNRDASQTKGLWRCQGRVMLALTGTPIMNSPDEIWSLLRWLWPEQYHELGARKNAVAYWSFYEDFVDYWEDHFGKKVITGVKNPDALRFALKDKLIRRLAPAGGRTRIYDHSPPLNPKQLKAYKEAEKAIWLEVSKEIAEGKITGAEAEAWTKGDITTLTNLPNGAARLVRLQQLIENLALLGGDDDSAIMDDLMQKIEDSGDEPWIIFFKFKESCSIFAERLHNSKLDKSVGIYTGDTPSVKRTEYERRFQAGELDIMVGTTGAMKEGITLTKSRLVARATESWVPAEDDQCDARADRMGQQRHVLVYVYRTPDTVAVSKVQPTTKLKRAIIKTVVPTNTVEGD